MELRLIKQIIYGVFYLLIIGLAAFYFYSFFNSKISESPGVAERLLPLSISLERAMVIRPNIVSLSAKVLNPNVDFGIGNFDYVWEVYDSSGNIIQTVPGKSFIYPGESKYIIISDSGVDASASSVKVVSGDSKNWDWLPMESFSKPKLNIVRQETSVSYGRIQITGSVVNGETKEFSRVMIAGILFNSFGREIAVSQTEVRDLRAFEERFFTLTFPSGIDGALVDFSKTQVFAETKISI